MYKFKKAFGIFNNKFNNIRMSGHSLYKVSLTTMYLCQKKDCKVKCTLCDQSAKHFLLLRWDMV